jgi:carboxypeptidase Taq
MELKQKIQNFENHYTKAEAYSYALSLISYDGETEGPSAAIEERSKAIGILSMEAFKHARSADYEKMIKDLEQSKDKLDQKWKRIVYLARKNIDEAKKIPPEEQRAFAELTTKAQYVWKEAKAKSDFKLFQPYLEKVVEFNRKFAKYLGPIDGKLYNRLLDGYEEGIRIEDLDKFFATLRARIVPLVKKIQASKLKINDDFLFKKVDHDDQMDFGKELASILGYNLKNGMIKETEHPFMNSISKNDVRFTTHIYENDFTNSMFSVAHEAGHAIYEQNIAEDLRGGPIGGGASMAFHESQSRFYENIVSRSESFISVLFPVIKKRYPNQMKGVTAKDFYLAINKVQPSLIRIEADELTYSLHIMVRYEIEKQLIAGEIEVKDLPKVWNQKYKEYLGVTPPNDAKGVLQDVHWSFGGIGYFFSYALGNAYSAQLLNAMKKDLDVKKAFKSLDLAPVRKWLYNHVYKYGRLLPPKELIKKATGEKLNPDYYCDYLEEKFSKIYNIK